MKNKLTDLNDHLFAEIERLGDEDLKGAELSEEVERARAVIGVASQIIANGQLILKAAQISDEFPGVGKYPLLVSK